MRDMVKAYGMPPITISYYLNAMNFLVEKLENKRREIMFLVTTDSPMEVSIFWYAIFRQIKELCFRPRQPLCPVSSDRSTHFWLGVDM